jgi:aminobenzoyl-glutamate transport protein
MAQPTSGRRAWLQRLEGFGNRLPEPTSLFVLGTFAIMLLSQLAVAFQWSVLRPAGGGSEAAAERIFAVSLLDSEGIWWLLSNLVSNFIEFPPLGLVLVGLLGIGVAERSGLLPVLLSRLLRLTPARFLDPMTVFIGILSSVALDAGYVVLPPLAAVLYAAAGRSPLTGIGVVTAGVTAGFSANLFLTGLDPLLAGLSTAGAQILDPDYQVAITANWWFMIASTLVLTLTGWAVARFVLAPHWDARDDLPAAVDHDQRAGVEEARGLRWAGVAFVVLLLLTLAMVLVPGWPLHGSGSRFPRWMEAMVPLILLTFLLPGVAYGVGAGSIRNDRDLVGMMAETLRSMGPYIVLVFFAAQFIAVFGHSRLGEMLAIAGGRWLAQAGLSATALALAFVLVVMTINLLMGSASAKYALLAPVFVPMFMQAGISPELTQAAYRVGDSVTNGITPFNPYLVIILSLVQRYAPGAGLGTLLSMMLPFALAFALTWSLLLGLWVAVGAELGPAGGLVYPPP